MRYRKRLIRVVRAVSIIVSIICVAVTLAWLSTGRFELLFVLSMLVAIAVIGIQLIIEPRRKFGFRNPSVNTLLGYIIIGFIGLLVLFALLQRVST